jgi:hypothetical protein
MNRWGGRGHKGGGMMMMGRMADANHDGVVTKAEFVAAAMQRFDKADTNHDGIVTKAERQAVFQAMRGQMHERWKDRSDMPGNPPATPPAN